MRQAANNAILELIESKDFKKCIGKIKPEYLQEDLASEVYLALLETNPEKIVDLQSRGELRFYAVRIILNMAHSNTSNFYTKYRVFETEQQDHFDNDIYEEDIYKRIDLESLLDESGVRDRKKSELLAFSLIDELYWYDAAILKAYLVYGDYRSVARETKIPLMSIYCTARKAIKDLKKLVDKAELPKDKDISGLIYKVEQSLKVDM